MCCRYRQHYLCVNGSAVFLFLILLAFSDACDWEFSLLLMLRMETINVCRIQEIIFCKISCMLTLTLFFLHVNSIMNWLERKQKECCSMRKRANPLFGYILQISGMSVSQTLCSCRCQKENYYYKAMNFCGQKIVVSEMNPKTDA